jgi:hypothetical protein
MPNRATNRALGQLHKLLSPGYYLPDEQLLERFVIRHSLAVSPTKSNEPYRLESSKRQISQCCALG